MQGAGRPAPDEEDEDDPMDEEEDEEVAYQDDEELDAEDDMGVGSMEVHDMHLGSEGAGSLPSAPVPAPDPEPSLARLTCRSCKRLTSNWCMQSVAYHAAWGSAYKALRRETIAIMLDWSCRRWWRRPFPSATCCSRLHRLGKPPG